MNREQMDAAIRASKSKRFPLMAEWGDGQWSVTAHDTAAFIAGMRAAAEIAENEHLCDPVIGSEPDLAYDRAIDDSVNAIRLAADSLEDK